MLEMILYALGLPDSSFYHKPDIFDKIYQQVTEIDERYGSAVIGPMEFDAEKETRYPFFCIWKTNTHDNAEFIPPEDAYVLLTHLETNNLYLFPLFENPDKIPSPYVVEKKNTTSEEKNVRLSFTYEHLWQNIDFKKVQKTDGNYQIQLICGKVISNGHKFNVSGLYEKDNYINELKKELEVKNLSLSEEDKELFTKRELSPKLPPDKDNIEIKPEKNSISKNDNSFVINGSYNIQLPESLVDIPIVLNVIVQICNGGIMKEKIIIPLELAENDKNSFRGYFAFDLLEYIHKNMSTDIIPEKIVILAVTGSVSSNILEIKEY